MESRHAWYPVFNQLWYVGMKPTYGTKNRASRVREPAAVLVAQDPPNKRKKVTVTHLIRNLRSILYGTVIGFVIGVLLGIAL